MENTKTTDIDEIKELKDSVKVLSEMITDHKDEISQSMERIEEVSSFVKMVKKRPSILNFFDDKMFVIIGVVAIAIISIFFVTDPVNILMSIISGLFGLASGRSMNNKDKNE